MGKKYAYRFEFQDGRHPCVQTTENCTGTKKTDGVINGLLLKKIYIRSCTFEIWNKKKNQVFKQNNKYQFQRLIFLDVSICHEDKNELKPLTDIYRQGYNLIRYIIKQNWRLLICLKPKCGSDFFSLGRFVHKWDHWYQENDKPINIIVCESLWHQIFIIAISAKQIRFSDCACAVWYDLSPGANAWSLIFIWNNSFVQLFLFE